MSHCYRVRFYLSSPLCFATNKAMRPLMLDAILAYQWMRQNGHYKTTAENAAENLIFPELPLERVGKCYGASAMIIPQEAVFMEQDAYVRQANWERAFSKQTPNFFLRPGMVGSGHFRAYLEPIWLMTLPYVDFYANVTDDKTFRELLHLAVQGGFLGSKRGSGYGRIAKCTLQQVEENPPWGFHKNGNPTRPLPVADFAAKLSPPRVHVAAPLILRHTGSRQMRPNVSCLRRSSIFLLSPPTMRKSKKFSSRI